MRFLFLSTQLLCYAGRWPKWQPHPPQLQATPKCPLDLGLPLFACWDLLQFYFISPLVPCNLLCDFFIFFPFLRHLLSHMKKSQQQGMETFQDTSPCEWEAEGRRRDRPENALTPSQLSEQDLKTLAASLQALPDLEYGASSTDPKGKPARSRRASADLIHDAASFAPDYEDFEYRGDTYTLPGPYEEEPLPNLAVFETCSPASSESSIDICFLRPVNFTTEPERTEHTVQPLPKSCAPITAPSSSSTYRREVFRSKGKQLSRSLKEFPRSGTEGAGTRLYSTRSSSGSRLPSKQERVGFQPHAISASSRSSQRNFFPPQRGGGEKQSFLEVRRAKGKGKPQQGLRNT